MKFGKMMADKKVLTWSFYYLDYNAIKKMTARKATSTAELQQREQNFAETLERELQKINSFHSLKASELVHALKSIKRSIKEQLKDDTDPEEISPIWLKEITTQLDNITDELIHFDEYKTINVCAFIKLLKKHDKHQSNQLRGFWAIRLQKESFVANHPSILDKLLLKLSNCWFLAKQSVDQKMNPKKDEVKSKQQNFERSTTKYWVPMDKVLYVKTEVLKNLPISSFNKKSSSLITSVYYDSEDLKLYHERLRKEEGSIIIRMRTYNEPPQATVFVERKVHHDSWVSEKSVKSRFPIKEKNLIKYLKGELSMTDKLNKLKDNNMISQKEYESTLQLATEIQDTVVKRKLQPTMTSRYERTAFQLEGTAKVRVSLDCRLDLISEFGYRDNKWGRDLSNEGLIMDSEICHFPHAVLEIKLSLEMGEESPDWVKRLLAQEYIISCGKFSKFVHGCAVLLPKKVNLLPNWFPLLEQTSDFRADDKILRTKSEIGIMSKAKYPIIQHVVSDIKIDISNTPDSTKGSKNKANNEIELVTKSDGDKKAGTINTTTNNNNKSIKKKKGFTDYFPVFKKSTLKKIQPSIKIEPKTFFANERTFIQWLSFLVIIQALGFALMNMGTKPFLRVGGMVFVCTALAFMIYAISLFLIRRHRIATRQVGPYDERLGPILIVALLMIGLIVTIVVYFGNYALDCKGTPMLFANFYKYNPSETVWDYDREQLVFVGPDIMTYIDTKNFKTYDVVVPGDLEGLTTVPFRKGFKYIGVEFPASIIEYDETAGKITHNIPLRMPGISSQIGLEGLAFVPITNHPHGGVFWAGSQFDGKVYVYDIDLAAPPTTEVVAIEIFSPIPNLEAISALNYQRETGLVYGIVARRWLFAMNPSTKEVTGTWPIGVGNPEGVTIIGSGPNYKSFLACDACTEIWQFKFSNDKGFHSGACGTILPAEMQVTTGVSMPGFKLN